VARRRLHVHRGAGQENDALVLYCGGMDVVAITFSRFEDLSAASEIFAIKVGFVGQFSLEDTVFTRLTRLAGFMGRAWIQALLSLWESCGCSMSPWTRLMSSRTTSWD
jgi:hypothetical protein